MSTPAGFPMRFGGREKGADQFPAETGEESSVLPVGDSG